MSNPITPERSTPVPEPQPASGSSGEAIHPGREEEEAASEQGLVNRELDRQTSVARPPLGN